MNYIKMIFLVMCLIGFTVSAYESVYGSKDNAILFLIWAIYFDYKYNSK